MPLGFIAVIKPGFRLRHVHRKRAKRAQIFTHTQRRRAVLVRQLHAAIKRDAGWQPAHDLRLHNVWGKAIVFPHFANADVEVGLPFTFQNGQRSIRLDKMLLAAVLFFDGHVQIPTRAGGIEIGKGKRSLRYGRLIDDVTVLLDRHHGVAFRYAAHHRCEAVHAGGQHVIIGVKPHPAQSGTIKNIACRPGIAHHELAAQPGNITL